MKAFDTGAGPQGYSRLKRPCHEEERWMREQTSRTAALLATALLATAAIALEVGDVAPDFELPGSDGETYRLEDYRGKSAVVIAWFPKAFTGG